MSQDCNSYFTNFTNVWYSSATDIKHSTLPTLPSSSIDKVKILVSTLPWCPFGIVGKVELSTHIILLYQVDKVGKVKMEAKQ